MAYEEDTLSSKLMSQHPSSHWSILETITSLVVLWGLKKKRTQNYQDHKKMYFILLWLQPHYSAWERTLRFLYVTAHSEAEGICIIFQLAICVACLKWKAPSLSQLAHKTNVFLPSRLDVCSRHSLGRCSPDSVVPCRAARLRRTDRVCALPGLELAGFKPALA